MDKICFIGLGYIGLPTAAVVAGTKQLVHGVDINPKVVETINKGEIHIIEPGLGDWLNKWLPINTCKLQQNPSKAMFI